MLLASAVKGARFVSSNGAWAADMTTPHGPYLTVLAGWPSSNAISKPELESAPTGTKMGLGIVVARY
jgi:hypothetical protein